MAEQQDVTNRPRCHPDRQAGAASPGAKNITPSNANFLDHVAFSIYVGGQGTLIVVDLDGEVIQYTNFAGRIPVMVCKVLVDDGDGNTTTATNIVAEW
jgi:hypothetical protein